MRSYNDQRWPALTFKILPHNHLVIINDWIPHLVFQHRLSHLTRVFLIPKLPRMHPNEHHSRFINVSVLERLQIRQSVQTVYAAVRPEIQNYYFSH